LSHFFSHGFAITYGDLTSVIPPKNVDVVMVAPKGSGLSVRRNFLDGSGINSSFAIFQDYTGKAEEKALALGATSSRFIEPTGMDPGNIITAADFAKIITAAYSNTYLQKIAQLNSFALRSTNNSKYNQTIKNTDKCPQK